jgi:cell division protein FtsL
MAVVKKVIPKRKTYNHRKSNQYVPAITHAPTTIKRPTTPVNTRDVSLFFKICKNILATPRVKQVLFACITFLLISISINLFFNIKLGELALYDKEISANIQNITSEINDTNSALVKMSSPENLQSYAKKHNLQTPKTMGYISLKHNKILPDNSRATKKKQE